MMSLGRTPQSETGLHALLLLLLLLQLLLLLLLMLLLLLRWNIAQGGSLLMMMRVALWLHDARSRVTPQTN
jgi:hypothetical protein